MQQIPPLDLSPLASRHGDAEAVLRPWHPPSPWVTARGHGGGGSNKDSNRAMLRWDSRDTAGWRSWSRGTGMNGGAGIGTLGSR